MALVTCLDCKKEISNTARKCVFCGYQSNTSIFNLPLGFDGHLFRITILLAAIAALSGYREGLFVAAFGVLFLLIRSLR